MSQQQSRNLFDGVSDTTRAPGVLIALHGHGDSPVTALAWGRRVAPPEWLVLTPSADFDSDGERSWFDSGSRGVNERHLDESLTGMESAVERARQVAPRVVVAGFSQGAALALAMAWRGTAADRVVAMCGFFPETVELGDPVAERRARILVLGAAGDEAVPAFMGSDAAAMFDTAGFEVQTHTLPGGHHVSAAMAAIGREFAAQGMTRRPYISLSLPVDRVGRVPEFAGATAVSTLAQGYESLGFHAAYVTDHPAPDQRWLEGGGHHALEPAAVLGAAAVATQNLKLHTNIYVLPYRNPFLSAKALASIDALSGGRLIAGVAAGYLRPEFAALGADFDGRGAALEDALRLLPEIWSGQSVAGQSVAGGSAAGQSVAGSSSGWSARSVVALPATHGGPPIWIGGNSNAALRRAVTWAQGWSPMPTPAGMGRALRTSEINDHQSLGARLRQAADECERVGRVEPLDICFVPFSLGSYLKEPARGQAALVEEVAVLSDVGVDWFPLMVPGYSVPEVLDNAAALAEGLAQTVAIDD